MSLSRLGGGASFSQFGGAADVWVAAAGVEEANDSVAALLNSSPERK